jgi:hypothetical protein
MQLLYCWQMIQSMEHHTDAVQHYLLVFTPETVCISWSEGLELAR